jgi:hypothetical protein
MDASRTVQWEEAEPWGEPVQLAGLLDDLTREINRYVVLPKWAPEMLALWVVHTYAFELRDITTYLAIESPVRRCGKTTLLMVLIELVNRPVVAANISPPAFFRVIEEARPTLLIDEADTFLKGNEELRGILNSGYTKKTAYVVRVAPRRRRKRGAGEPGASERGGGNEDGMTLVKFSSWCPKAVAAIGKLPDTLEDRCILVRMQRKTENEVRERVRDMDGRVLRRQCARFVKDHRGEISSATPQIPAGLNDRAADIWEPLLALAELAGEEWAQKARQAAEALTASAEESNPIGSLLVDILVTFARAKGGRLFTRAMVCQLNGFRNRPWMEMTKGKEVTEMWLAQQLRPYGVRPRTLRIEEARGKGYCLEDFTEVFRRYMPKADIAELLREAANGAGPEND